MSADDVVPGLPERLPATERLLWQGAPDWRVLARRGFHVRKLAAYFAVIVAWMAATNLTHGGTMLSVAVAAAAGTLPVLLVLLYAWGVARTTIYTVTDRRVVIRAGIALPMSINLPFAQIAAADLAARSDGSGDIALSLSLTKGDRLAYFMVWPHARPWRFARAEPMLRGLKDVHGVAQVLARALAVSADRAAPVLLRDARGGASPAHEPLPA